MQHLKENGVDAIMVGRGAIGNPFIFKQINYYIKNESYERCDGLLQLGEYLKLAEKYNMSFSTTKVQAMSFTKGMYGATILRDKMTKCKSSEELNKILKTSRNNKNRTKKMKNL